MPFQEKSAWIMSLSLLLGGAFYFGAITAMSGDSGQLVPPILPTVVIYTAILIIVSIVGHIAIAVFSPKEANGSLDEREQIICHRAGHTSGYVLAIGIVSSLGLYLFSGSGDVLFYCIFASLMISQLVEYAVRIFLYRTAV